MAHKEIDLKNPKTNRKNAGFTDEERQKFTELTQAGFLDTFRYFILTGREFIPGGLTVLKREKKMPDGDRLFLCVGKPEGQTGGCENPYRSIRVRSLSGGA